LPQRGINDGNFTTKFISQFRVSAFWVIEGKANINDQLSTNSTDLPW